jgi:multimeric flavodoxin WrbA
MKFHYQQETEASITDEFLKAGIPNEPDAIMFVCATYIGNISPIFKAFVRNAFSGSSESMNVIVVGGTGTIGKEIE